MSQDFKEPEYQSDYHLTEEEVEAIVKRYGESEAGGSTQPTVKDVAEALHVEPGVVAKLLSDVRSAKTQGDLKTRLDALEAENTELRERAERTNYPANDMWNMCAPLRPAVGHNRRVRIMMIGALVFGVMFAFRGVAGTGRPTSLIWLLIGVLALVFFLTRIKQVRR